MNRIFIFLCTFFISVSIHAETAANVNTNLASRPDVQAFIDRMVTKYHFKKASLTSLFNKVKVRSAVIQSIKTPLESRPWFLYKRVFLTEKNITQGVAFWDKYEAILDKAEKTYGVPASIIVATMGVETGYGKGIGGYRVIDALSTLAFGSTPRAPYFRTELEQFLLLTRELHLDPLKEMGSYAGAMGQPQFMPSSYREYAINFSGSGKVDLTHNVVDVIGSIANYYNKNGWLPNRPVAIPASNSGGRYLVSYTRPKPIALTDLIDREEILDLKYLDESTTKLVKLQTNYGEEYWLAYPNFDVIKRYNPSTLYAMAVYQLSYYIKALRQDIHHD